MGGAEELDWQEPTGFLAAALVLACFPDDSSLVLRRRHDPCTTVWQLLLFGKAGSPGGQCNV